jgi:hypothetical protein
MAVSHSSEAESPFERFLMLLVTLVAGGYERVYEFVDTHAPEFTAAAPEPVEGETPRMAIMQQIRMVGGAVILIAIVVLVVNEVLTVNAINNSSGPFAGVIDQLNTTGVAAMGLLVVGLVVAAARAIMGFMGGGGF